jgi:hypothetical protein
MESTTSVPEVCKKKKKKIPLVIYDLHSSSLSLKPVKITIKRDAIGNYLDVSKKKSPYVIDNIKIHVLMI